MKRLRPYIDKGIANGIFVDDSPIVSLWKTKAKDPQHEKVIKDLGGLKQEVAQNFVTDTVLVDLSAILRKERYTAHLEVWEVKHTTVGLAKGNPRPACFMMGQAVVEDGGGATLDSALFRMALWDDDVALADDVEADGTYVVPITTRKGGLDAEVIDLQTLSGLTNFKPEKFSHGSREELLREMFDVTPIADLEDNLSKTPQDFRLVEAMVSFSGVQNSRAGNQFGKMLLKDDSTMTMDAIESGENLMLNALTSTSIVSRFGKYSRILVLCTVKDAGEYGISANIETAVGLVVVEPPKVESTTQKDEDDAATYFSSSSPVIDIGDDDDDDDEGDDESVSEDSEGSEDPETKEDAQNASDEAESTKDEDTSDSDDDWDDWD